MGIARRAEVVSFTEIGDQWIDVGGGIAETVIYTGDRDDPDAPAFLIVRAGRDVGDRISGARTHDTPCMTVVIDGTVQLDGQWLGPGGIELAPAGVVHGDLVVGPEGAVFGVLFGARSGLVARFVDSGDQRRYDTEAGRDVERVAAGEAELPLRLLLPKDDYRPRRGVVVTDPAELTRVALSVTESK
jgi:hypothetical protein